MSIILVGEVVNTADDITGYNDGNISGDDDFVEGTGAIGLKVSAATAEMFTTALGATAPYDFSSAGSEFGEHIIMWFNSKSPIDPTAGFRIAVGNGADRGHWNVVPNGFYKGGFITLVVNSARAFDSIAAGAWTLSGNPAQLTSITEMGGVIQTPASIMGNFNNFQLDQFTIGLGVRSEGGTIGTPNNFEIVKNADEGAGWWGWWSERNGSIISKGKLFIGPEDGLTSEVFTSTAESVVFAPERVAQGFYEINIRGTNTTASFDLINISSATPETGSTRWNLFVSSSTHSFLESNGVWSGGDQLTLTTSCSIDGTTMINCNKLFQSGAAVSSINVLDANTAAGDAFMIADDISLIDNSTFNFSTGHAIEIPPQVITPVTYSFSGNSFNDYLASDTSGSAVFNNSGGGVLINIVDGGDTPTIRNSFGSSTEISNPVTFELTNLETDSEVRILNADTGEEIDGVESSGTTFVHQYNFVEETPIIVIVFHLNFVDVRLTTLSLTSNDQSVPIQQRPDRVFSNP